MITEKKLNNFLKRFYTSKLFKNPVINMNARKNNAIKFLESLDTLIENIKANCLSLENLIEHQNAYMEKRNNKMEYKPFYKKLYFLNTKNNLKFLKILENFI